MTATTFPVENGAPPDTRELLNRLDELEKKLARVEAENTHLKAELARKHKIIAGLQHRLFGSSSKKIDPKQLQFDLHVIKPEFFWRRVISKKFVHKTDKARPPVIAPAPLPSICPRYHSRHAG